MNHVIISALSTVTDHTVLVQQSVSVLAFAATAVATCCVLAGVIASGRATLRNAAVSNARPIGTDWRAIVDSLDD